MAPATPQVLDIVGQTTMGPEEDFRLQKSLGELDCSLLFRPLNPNNVEIEGGQIQFADGHVFIEISLAHKATPALKVHEDGLANIVAKYSGGAVEYLDGTAELSITVVK